MCMQYKSFENFLGKGEIARDEQYLIFPHCFLLFFENSVILIKFEIVFFELFQFSVWKSLKLVIWKRLNSISLTCLHLKSLSTFGS